MIGRALMAAVILVSAGAPGTVAAQAPEGRLTLFAGNSNGANFIVEDSVRRTGDRVDVTIYRVYAEPITMQGGEVVHETTRLTIDCAAKRFRQGAVQGMASDGRVLIELPPEPEADIRERTTWDFTARVVCEGMGLPESATVTGHAAARALAMSRLGG